MKKFWQGNNYLKISLYALFVIIFSILFYRVSSNTDNIFPSIVAFFRRITGVLSPILYGVLIAYLFNPIMDLFERNMIRLFKPTKQLHRKQIRTLSIIIVYVVIIGSVILMIRYLVPQILRNILDLAEMLPLYAKESEIMLANVELYINQGITSLPFKVDTPKLFEMINSNLEKIMDFSKLNILFSTIIAQAYTLTTSLFNWIMGLVIAFYCLQQKNSFAHGSKRIIYGLFSPKTADKMINIFREGHQIFISFFVGKFIDSTIIGILCFIGLSFLDNPYALLLSVIVGVLNMIPYFGPFLGAIPAVLITLFEGWWPAVLVALFIFVLQQFDGLILGPKILGDSIGLSPFWIISGIILGGALWGPLGMFFASPIIAILLININRWIDKVLVRKEVLVPPLPTDPPKPPKKPRAQIKTTK